MKMEVMKMDEKQMIDDLIKQLDSSMAAGAGHINVDTDDSAETKTVQTMGCADCNKNSMACSVPTMLDDPEENQ